MWLLELIGMAVVAGTVLGLVWLFQRIGGRNVKLTKYRKWKLHRL